MIRSSPACSRKNVFKKRFCRKLGLSELFVECEKVATSLRSNELDADFKSRRKTLLATFQIYLC